MGKVKNPASMGMPGKAVCVTRGDLYAMIIATQMGRHKEVSSAVVLRLISEEGQNHYVIERYQKSSKIEVSHA